MGEYERCRIDEEPKPILNPTVKGSSSTSVQATGEEERERKLTVTSGSTPVGLVDSGWRSIRRLLTVAMLSAMVSSGASDGWLHFFRL